jgi:hypothetical protein
MHIKVESEASFELGTACNDVSNTSVPFRRKSIYCTCITAVFAILSIHSVWAADTGPSVTGNVCLQQLYGTPVKQANTVNCTANDIRLSNVVSVSPASCTKGTTFDLTVTYEIDVTANARYDAGFIFRIDGGTNARGDGENAGGLCSLSALTPPPPLNDPALDLDGDTCGDLNSGVYQVTFTIPDVVCEDPDKDEKLNLPYCTSWHSNHSTYCDIAEPFSEFDSVYFAPDTKSKCVCDDDFEVPVKVEKAELTVTKTADPTQLPEPGGQVTYTVTVKNTAVVESVVIDSIVDDIYGDLSNSADGDDFTMNDCPELIGYELGPQGELTCSFKANAEGNATDRITDKVTVCAIQADLSEEVCGSDTADVDITDVYNDPTVTKTAKGMANCQVEASYQVVVNNNSEVDTLTLKSLTDDMFGDITKTKAEGNDAIVSTNCSVPRVIGTLENYTCLFTGLIEDSDCEISHKNTVTAGTVDDDGGTPDTPPSDDATVTLTTTP